MATPIPSADAALLAAQARAGQAGIDAYNAAKAELAQQRQTAVQQAMEQAAARGAPAGAMESIMGNITSPYDSRTAALTQAQARYEADMAGRADRMDAYGEAVQGARGLIGEQVKLAVAPIDAQTRFQVSLLQQQGQNKVDEINAQLRLDQARLEAELQAAAARVARAGGGGGRGGSGGGRTSSLGSMNQSELRSSLVQGARQKLGAASEKAQRAVRQTAEQQRQAANYTGRGMSQWLSPRQAERRDLAREEALRQAASYTGRGMAEWERKQAQPSVRIQGSPTMRGGSVSFPATTITPSARPMGPTQGEAQLNAVRRALQQTIAARTAPGLSADQQTFIRQSALNNAPGYTNDVGFLTPQQLGEFAASPDAPLFAGLTDQPLRRIGSIAEIMGGAPRDLGMVNGEAVVGPQDPRSAEALRTAMMLSAFDLQDQGYDITDPEILEAIGEDELYDPGMSLADLNERAIGNEDVRTQMSDAEEQAIAEQERLVELQGNEDKAIEDELDATRRAVEQAFVQTTGVTAEKVGVDPAVGLEIVRTERFQQALGLVQGARDAREARDILLDSEFNMSDQYDRAIVRIVEGMYG